MKKDLLKSGAMMLGFICLCYGAAYGVFTLASNAAVAG